MRFYLGTSKGFETGNISQGLNLATHTSGVPTWRWSGHLSRERCRALTAQMVNRSGLQGTPWGHLLWSFDTANETC